MILMMMARPITIVASTRTTILCEMISITTTTTGPQLGVIVQNNELTKDMKGTWDAMKKAHACRFHSIEDGISNLIMLERTWPY